MSAASDSAMPRDRRADGTTIENVILLDKIGYIDGFPGCFYIAKRLDDKRVLCYIPSIFLCELLLGDCLTGLSVSAIETCIDRFYVVCGLSKSIWSESKADPERIRSQLRRECIIVDVHPSRPTAFAILGDGTEVEISIDDKFADEIRAHGLPYCIRGFRL